MSTPSGSMPPSLPPLRMEEPVADTPRMSEIQRLIGVFAYPGKAFKDIAQRPRWWVPLILSSLIAMAYLYAISEHIGWEQVIRTSLDRSPQARNMPPQQREQVIQLYTRFLPYLSYGGAIFTSLISLVVVSGILKFLADVILGAGIGFKRLMGVASYGFLPNAVKSLLSMVVMYQTPPDEFDMQNPLMFNVGAFISDPAWLKALGSWFDLFTIWTMILFSIGMAAAARKLTVGKAFGMLLLPMGLLVVLSVGYAALTG